MNEDDWFEEWAGLLFEFKYWPTWFRRLFVICFPISIPLWFLVLLFSVLIILPINILYYMWK